VIVTFETEGAQGALAIVHENTLFPKGNPVIEVVGDNELVMVPPPETKVQAPVPTPGVLAFITVVGEEIQRVCEVPALDVVGISLTIIATVDEEGEQGAFEIVQAKTFVPNGKPVIEVEGDNELVIVPPPETNVHAPVPTVAVLAVMKVFGLEIQSVCVVPALEAVGT
jgi:hypothetical protein